MSWNKCCIFITNPPEQQPEKLLSRLSLEDYEVVSNACIQETIKFYLDDPVPTFIGIFNTLVVISAGLPSLFLADSLSERAQSIIHAFPNSEILAMYENGTAYSFGYAAIRQQERIRLRIGDDGLILKDFGQVLIEEEQFQAHMQQNGGYQALVEEYLGDGLSPDETLQKAKFELGWRMPMWLSAKYLGQPLDVLESRAIPLVKCLPKHQ
ncbi:MAG: hypothetical protein ACFB14_07020 [Leptolyngbyaceae cyanobacterium]